MEPHFYWEWLIVAYLFLGGMSAGCYIISGLANFFGEHRYELIARWGAYFAPWPVMIGSALLILDLGSPVKFFRLFLTLRISSPMSIGTWLLTLFSVISLCYFLLWLPKSWTERFIRFDTLILRRILGILGVPLGMSVGIYTGILLGALPSRPFWNTPIVAMLFLASALSTATAMLIIVVCVKTCKQRDENALRQVQFLYSLDISVIFLEIFLVIPYILHNALAPKSIADSLQLILGGEFTYIFWIGFFLIGIIVPLIVESIEMTPVVLFRKPPHFNRFFVLLTGVSVIIGGFILRYVFVFAGQVSSFS